jgi:hypothetical protein
MADIFRVFAERVTSTTAVQVINLGTTSTAIIRSLSVCNTSTVSTASFDVLVERTLETSEFYLFRYTQVSAAQTVKPIESPVVLGGGDILKMSAGSGQVDAVATILETY